MHKLIFTNIIIIILIIILYLVFLFTGKLSSKNGGRTPDRSKAPGERLTDQSTDQMIDQFPYKQISFDDVKKRVENLRSYELKIVNQPYKIFNMPNLAPSFLVYNGIPTLAIVDKEDYALYDDIMDYYTEQCRMQCKRFDSLYNPYEKWTYQRQDIINLCKSKFGEVNRANLRETIFLTGTECTSFKSSLTVGFIKFFKATNMLDISAGWGNRLIGAIAAGITYLGVDPNVCVVNGMQKCINDFSYANKATVLNAPFEDVTLPYTKTNRPDFIFTSPPYFDLESYVKGGPKKEDQSIIRYNTIEKWYDGFLITALIKAWAVLQPGGHMVININNIRGRADYTWRMVQDIQKFSNCAYLGCIGQSTGEPNKSPQPFWCFRKIDELVINPPLVVSVAESNGRWFNVIRDDFLIGGTKQRGLVDYIMELRKTNPNLTEFIYAGPKIGFAQAALAFAVRDINNQKISNMPKLSATVFTSNEEEQRYTRPMYRAAEMGAHLIVMPNMTLKQLQETAEIYAGKEHNRKILPFGVGDEIYKNIMVARLREIIPVAIQTSIQRMWLDVGSATLLNIFAVVFPNAFFEVVQVGKTVWDDQLIKGRTKKYIAPEFFYEEAKTEPPYHSFRRYDAKLWQFVLQHGKNGDWIWNVA